MPIHTSTSTSWLPIFSRSTRRASGCPQSTQPRCRPHCHHQRRSVQAQSKAATRRWSLVRRQLSSGLNTRALDLSDLQPWIPAIMLLLALWVLLASLVGSMLPLCPLSHRLGLLRSGSRRRLDHILAQPMANSLLVLSAALLVALLLRSAVRVETLP